MQDLIVLGGGPAGLFCAIRAKERSPELNILILEKMDQCGRKLLTTGGGQCNLTREADARTLVKGFGKKGKFLGTAFSVNSPIETCRWFSSHGLALTVREDKKVFPASMKASDVRNLLVNRCRQLGIPIRYNTQTASIVYADNYFTIHFNDTSTIQCKKLVLATGGMSCPGTGSTGDGYRFAKQLGHSIIPPRPALSAAKVTNENTEPLEGLSLENATIRTSTDLFSGPLLFTRNGMSGPVVLDNSKYMQSNETIQVCMVMNNKGKPVSWEQFSQTIITEAKTVSQKQIGTILHNLTGLPTRFVDYQIQQAAIRIDLKGADLSNEQARRLAKSFCAWEMKISFEGAFRTCMATAGGIALDEIDSRTMMSRITPHLYFAGEVMDIDGICGGYNLQGAWSTAELAARTISEGDPLAEL